MSREEGVSRGKGLGLVGCCLRSNPVLMSQLWCPSDKLTTNRFAGEFMTSRSGQSFQARRGKAGWAGGREGRKGRTRGRETPVRLLSGGEILIGKEVREFSGFHCDD